MSCVLSVARANDGSVVLVGEAPERIRITQELLDSADPALVKLNDRGDIMFNLSNAALWYRRVGLVDDGRAVEFERVA